MFTAMMLAVLVLCFPLTGCSGDGSEGSATHATVTSAPTPPPAPDKPNRRVPKDLRDAEVIFAREDGIYTGGADGTRIRRIFGLPSAFEYQPDVSSDGSRVAVRVDGPRRVAGAWVFNTDGSNPLHLSETTDVMAGGPDWSPDGRLLVVNGKRPGEAYFGLWVISADGSEARRITPDEWEAQYPAWSPDGELIAFTRVVPARQEFSLYLVRPDGSGLRKLSRGSGGDNYAAWSPNGRELVFSSERPENAGLWLISADGSDERFLIEGGEPQWEPGEWIIFNCASAEERGKTCVVRPDGTALAELPLGAEAVFGNWIP